MTKQQDELIDKVLNLVEWMQSDYGGVTLGRLDRVREALDELEETLNE